MNQDILLIDKPVGITSFDVVRTLRTRLRKECGCPAPKLGHATTSSKLKIGHAGTLDPLASGLLIVGVGDGTKKMEAYLKLPKTYEVTMCIGESRTTGDLEGEIIEEKKVYDLSADKAGISRYTVEEVAKDMTGTLELRVPRYSAIKVGGEPLYKKARRGEKFEPPVRTMTIQNIEIQKVTCARGRCHLEAIMDVKSGVYIRSVVEEFGRRLGYPATTAALRRTKIGEFEVKNARKLEDIKN